MIFCNDTGITPYIAGIDALYRASFDGLTFAESDPAEIRSLLFSENGDLAGHAAIKQNRYDFIKNAGQSTWILGYVCTDRAMRGRGYAMQCMGELFAALLARPQLWIMILNCRPDLVGFYEKAGFEKISDTASYDRQGRLVVDNDPVLAKCSVPELKAAIVPGTILHLGIEF